MLIAQISISTEGIGIIIAAVFVGLIQMLTLILQYLRDKNQIKRDIAVAARVDKVGLQATLAAEKAEQAREQTHLSSEDIKALTEEQGKKIDEVAEKVEQVHRATNSMKDELVAATDKEAHRRGTDEERKRAEEEKKEKP